ncbi:MAG: hypothetical protein AB2L13_09955 [Spirochaetota bacterium]
MAGGLDGRGDFINGPRLQKVRIRIRTFCKRPFIANLPGEGAGGDDTRTLPAVTERIDQPRKHRIERRTGIAVMFTVKHAGPDARNSAAGGSFGPDDFQELASRVDTDNH